MLLNTGDEIRAVKSFIKEHYPDTQDFCTINTLAYVLRRGRANNTVIYSISWSGALNQIEVSSDNFYPFHGQHIYDTHKNVFVRHIDKQWLYQVPQRARLCAMWHNPTTDTVIDRLPWDIVKMIGQYI